MRDHRGTDTLVADSEAFCHLNKCEPTLIEPGRFRSNLVVQPRATGDETCLERHLPHS